MTMSDRKILQAKSSGLVVIEPFRRGQLATSSYDVRLGEYFFREQAPELDNNIFNIYDPDQVAKVWGKAHRAPEAQEVLPAKFFEISPNQRVIKETDQIIIVGPGETILGHTEEFIGGRVSVTTMMKARSSLGRSFILVCKCIHPDTLIRKNDGSEVKISELLPADAVINVTRYGQSRSARVKSITKSPVPKRTLTIRTKSNRSITVSEDHLFRVSCSDGDRILAACDLGLGDALPVLRQAPRQGGSFMTSPMEAALIGYFLAEGNWQKYRISFAKSIDKPEERAEIMDWMKALFPDAPDPKCDDTQIMYNSVQFAEQFQFRYPELCRLAEHKRIPPRVMNTGDLGSVKAFLKSYMRCDAHLDPDALEVEFTSRSEGLIHDLAYLTSRFGSCPTRFKQRKGTGTKGPCFSAYYYGNDATRLGHWLEEKVPRSWSVNIPDLMRDIKKKYNLTREQLEGYDVTSEKSISRKKLETIWQNHNVTELAPYVRDIVWDTIVEITTSPILQAGFIDISLHVDSEEDALFALSNGLMTLNCAGWGDVGYINRWTFEITNVSRYYSIPLLVGGRVAQLIFEETGMILDQNEDYTSKGAYQSETDLEILKETWVPETMLPKVRP